MSVTSVPQGRRVLRVAVLDKEGQPALGAKVAFFEDDLPYGTADIAERGASIELPDTVGVIEIHAEFMQKQLKAIVPKGLLLMEFRFGTSSPLLKAVSPRVARCPDGSSGQPCVDCVIDGKPIRICT